MYFEMYYEYMRILIMFIELIFFFIVIPTIATFLRLYIKREVSINELIMKALKYRFLTVICIFISIVSILDFIFKMTLTEQRIGSFYEEKNYNNEFYILVSNKPFKENKEINRVPALIHSVRGGLENNSYYIKSMFFNNQTIYFNDLSEIFLNSDWKVEDEENNIYYVQLTKESVE